MLPFSIHPRTMWVFPTSIARIIISGPGLSAEFYKTYDRRAENDVYCKFYQEVGSDKPQNHVAADICSKARAFSPLPDGIKEEEPAAEKENTGIDHGAYHCCTYRSKQFVFLLKSSVYNAGNETCQSSLEQNGYNCSDRIDRQKRGGVA